MGEEITQAVLLSFPQRLAHCRRGDGCDRDAYASFCCSDSHRNCGKHRLPDWRFLGHVSHSRAGESPGVGIYCGSVRVPRVGPWRPKKGGRTATILRTTFLLIGSIALSACDLRGAPSYSIFGAYFPAWLLCSAIGILGSVALRAAVVASGLEDAIPLRLLVYVGFAAAVALWLWLSLFGGQ